MTTDIDLVLRGAAIAVLGLLAGLMWVAPISRDGRLSVLAVAVTKSAFLLLPVALAMPLTPAIARALGIVASGMPLAVTWLLLCIFLDPPTPRWPWLTAAGLVVVSLLATDATGPLPAGYGLLGTALYAGLLALALWPARDDLVECRCRARPGFAAAIAGYGLVIAGLEAFGGVDPATPWFTLLQSGGTLALALAFAVWILRPDASRWPGLSDAPQPLRPSRPTVVPSPEDAALIARINAAMDQGIWREEGLTIGALAARLAVPEHRVRRAINQGLGHRNFSSFVNRARIKAAQEALSDPDQMGRTVLEIAYDVGFASLGPFNRAFRAETGQSPSEFRRTCLTHAPAETRKSAPIPSHLH
jgi:AraC-like DNA-binding protein